MPDVSDGGPASFRRSRRDQYAGRPEEIRRLAAGLSDKGKPGERAAAVAVILTGAGDVLRRSRAIGADARGVSEALSSLSRDDVVGWLSGVKIESIRAALARAMDDGFEATLAETGEEREARSRAALEALAERDRVESGLAGLGRWEAERGALSGGTRALREALRSSLARLDAQLGRGARSLVALNDARRAERDLLDEGGRGAAWWFGARADCDDLVALFATPGAKIAHCAACVRDAREARAVERPPVRHVSSDEMFRQELGLLSDGERAYFEGHVAHCSSCKHAMRASSEADETIAELVMGNPRRAAAQAAVDEPAPLREEVVLLEHAAFRAVLLTASRRLKVRVEPLREGAVARASVTFGDGEAMKPRKTAQGLEWNLGSLHRVAGQSAVLRVELEGAAAVELKLPLLER